MLYKMNEKQIIEGDMQYKNADVFLEYIVQGNVHI